MLVLSRKAGEKILIGDDISVTIVRIGPGVVRVGIEAPPEMAILREELADPAREPAMIEPVAAECGVNKPR